MKSANLAKIRVEQRALDQRLTPAERLMLAVDLSDVCNLLNEAGRKALVRRHAAETTEKNQRDTHSPS